MEGASSAKQQEDHQKSFASQSLKYEKSMLP